MACEKEKKSLFIERERWDGDLGGHSMLEGIGSDWATFTQ